MKKILVPTDFSPTAQLAIDFALELAIRQKAELFFLHFLDIPVNWAKLSMMTPYTAKMSEEEKQQFFPEWKSQVGTAQQNLQDLVKKAERAGIKAHPALFYEFKMADLSQLIVQLHIDGIVMGTEGATGLKAWTGGSQAQKFIRMAPCPVITLKTALDLANLQKIVFAYDFAQTQALQDFTGLLHFCQELGAKLHLLYVNTPANFKDTAQVLNQMDAFLEAHGLFGKIEKHIYNDQTIEDGIVAFAHIYQMDLIALTTHGYGGVRRFLQHSITENLVNFSDKNLLCLHF